LSWLSTHQTQNVTSCKQIRREEQKISNVMTQQNREKMDSLEGLLDFAPGEWRLGATEVLNRSVSSSKPVSHSGASKKLASTEYFEIPKPRMTPELKAELTALKLKQYMDPKRFYKSADRLGERFVFGVMVDGGLRAVGGGQESQSAGTFNKSKTKGKSLLQEALADVAVQSWTKKRWSQVDQRLQRDKKLSRRPKKL
jgi:hypothetical protein